MTTGEAHGIKGAVQFARGTGSTFANPAVLAGAAEIMAQVAMQQTMDEITDYLAAIDEKVDDLLRAQKDTVLADMIGVDLVIDEAMTVREAVGRVSETTWSKVQSTTVTIARTQAYALRQLDALAEKVERKAQLSDLAKSAKDAEVKTREWLAVLARCFQLQEAIAFLELDRVLEAAPEELDSHRQALRTAREKRLQIIARSTLRMLERMSLAAESANTKVLLHPVSARSVVDSSNVVAAGIDAFHVRLGMDEDGRSLDAKRWREAVTEMKDRLVQSSTDGVGAAKRLGTDTVDRTTAVFRAVDLDGDGVPDKPRALTAMEDAGAALKGAGGGVAGAVGSVFRRRRSPAPSIEDASASVQDDADPAAPPPNI